MNFPMQYALFQFLYNLVNTPGIGGVLVLVVAFCSLSVYSITLRWIARGGQEDEAESYSYPTPALHHSGR